MENEKIAKIDGRSARPSFSEEDLRYLGTEIGMLAGIPVRLLTNGHVDFYYSVIHLPVDPMTLHMEEILSVPGPVGYYTTEDFYYYGIVRFESRRMVIGPTRQVPGTDQNLRRLAFRLGLADRGEIEELIGGMKSIIRLPIMNLVQMLLPVCFILTGQRLSLMDLTISGSEQDALSAELKTKEADHFFDNSDETCEPAQKAANADAPQPEETQHNSYGQEQLMLRMIRQGDMVSLKAWIDRAPAIRPGSMAPNQLRQQKNTFVTTATIVSRAAIEGGVPVEEAFQLSDAYIRKAELLPDPDRIMNLQYHMVLDFCDRVRILQGGGHPSPLVLKVHAYILQHLSEPVTTEDIADALFMSRSYVSRCFRKEAGVTLQQYIRDKKIEEAKRLLLYTDKPVTSISVYLGYSSPGHFSRVFRESTGKTPMEYREDRSMRTANE